MSTLEWNRARPSADPSKRDYPSEFRLKTNELLAEGSTLLHPDVLRLIRAAAFPILLDIHTIVDEQDGRLIPRPQAKKALEALAATGDVFVMSPTLPRVAVETVLTYLGASPSTTLITGENYTSSKATCEAELSDPASPRSEMVDAYLRMVRANKLETHMGMPAIDELSPTYHEDMERLRLALTHSSPSDKNIAAFFLKPWAIPLLDTEPASSEKAYGSMTVWARPVDVRTDKNAPRSSADAEAVSFESALESLRSYKRSLEKAGQHFV